MDNLKVLLVSEDKSLVAELKQLFLEYKVEEVMPRDVQKEFDRISPDFVILVEQENDASIEYIQFMMSLNPLVQIVFIARKQDFILLREITRTGVVDFFVIPEETTLLHSRLPSILQNVKQQKKVHQETAATTFKKGRGQIYAFYSAKGGSGRTLISASLAQTMKFESTAQILLIDLNLQYGGIETVLSIKSNRSLADLRPVITELNENHIHNVTERENHSQLEILLSPGDAELAESITEEFVSTLLRTCRRNFDFVIVDLPSQMNGNTYMVLEEADKIYYVLTPDTPTIRAFKKAEELFFRLGMNLENRLKVVMNQVGSQNEIQPKDITGFIPYPIEAKIRWDSKGIQPALNKGELLRKEAHEKKICNFSKDIRKWVQTILM